MYKINISCKLSLSCEVSFFMCLGINTDIKMLVDFNKPVSHCRESEPTLFLTVSKSP